MAEIKVSGNGIYISSDRGKAIATVTDFSFSDQSDVEKFVKSYGAYPLLHEIDISVIEEWLSDRNLEIVPLMSESERDTLMNSQAHRSAIEDHMSDRK